MRVMVIGAGIVGVATAFMLVRAGAEVTLVDEGSEPATGTSHANGAQLCYSYVAPLAGPGVVAKLPAWLIDPHSPVRFRPRLDPHQWAWCMKFLLRCNHRDSNAASAKLLALSALSSRLLDALLPQLTFDFDYNRRGKLVAYSSAQSWDAAQRQVERQRALGSAQDLLDADQCMALEPALAPAAPRLKGGVFTAGDHTGDARKFALGLLAQAGSALNYVPNTKVHAFHVRGGRVDAISTRLGSLTADHFILANGVGANALLRPHGMRLPIYPIRGYSLTAACDAQRLPRMSFTDYDRRVVYAPLGERLRIAGMADIAGYETEAQPRRIATLAREARALFNLPQDTANQLPWVGLRPATPSGLPIVGPSRLANLSLNLGHGALGWTLALATAHQIASTVAGNQPSLH